MIELVANQQRVNSAINGRIIVASYGRLAKFGRKFLEKIKQSDHEVHETHEV
jgi:hypothetical protein